MNRFLYAEANPATLSDPTGHGVDCGIGMTCTNEERAAETERQQAYAARQAAVRQASDEDEQAYIKKAHTSSAGGAETPTYTSAYAASAGIPADWVAQLPPLYGSLDDCGAGSCLVDETGFVYDPSGDAYGRAIPFACQGSGDVRACLILLAIQDSQRDPNGACTSWAGCSPSRPVRLGAGRS